MCYYFLFCQIVRWIAVAAWHMTMTGTNLARTVNASVRKVSCTNYRDNSDNDHVKQE